MLKNLIIFIVSLLIIISIAFCITKPKMHKPLQVNIIEYLLKINTDGSVTTTKSITTHEVKEKK